MPKGRCNHTVGYIPGTQQVTSENWNRELDRFALVIEDFNVRGQRDQICHPGFIVEGKFCGECGAALDRAGLGLRTLTQARQRVADGVITLEVE